MTKDCSIIIPCFKSPFNLLNKCIEDIISHWDTSKFNLEIILIVDGGIKKNSEEFIEYLKIKKKNQAVQLLHNKLHIGQHKSTLNGFDYSNADIIITIDDDYKYPVENLSKLVEKIYTEELDCIIGKPKILDENKIRKFGTWLIKKVFNNVYKKIYFTSFRVLKKDVTKLILKKNYIVPVIGYLILEETNQVENFIYEKNINSNLSRYNYFSLISFFFNMNFFYTNFLYKTFIAGGIVLSAISLFLSIYYVYVYLFHNIQPGFTTTTLLILLLIQFFLYGIGLVLKYITTIIFLLREIKTEKNFNYEEIK